MTETKTKQKLYNKSVDPILSNRNNQLTELMNYSPIELKDYDRERHVTINQAYNLLSENEISVDTFQNALDNELIKKYNFNGETYVDLLDMGRVYNKPKANKKGLTIDRYFTDGVIDPFTTVGEYESRHLQITDINGNALFDMPDAVFPKSWNNTDAKIVAEKYFYKPSKPEWKDKLKDKINSEYENSISHLVNRVTNFIVDEGDKLGYFETKEDKEAFKDELAYLQINRMFAFNSPVQFNAGLENEYGIEGSPGINYWRNPDTGEVVKIEDGCNIKPQCHACFIKSPSDNLESILIHAVDEGGIFSSGSGIGGDIGQLRGEGESLSGGGKSSGPMSFFKIYDDSAGSIKSGGKSRRAARMQTMRYHHPDSLTFIRSKVREDKKALVLMENGYGPGMDGEAYQTVTYQNTNLSVRLDDHFFKQLNDGREIELRNVTDGKVIKKIPAEQMLKEISFGSWRVGDPAVQYESKIQEMHTCKNSGNINSSNPCSEYMFLDNSSCNLGSTNLLEFSDKQGNFDVESYIAANKTTTIALDILNDSASYPVRDIAAISPEFRTVGLGYSNLGALLMRKGLAYDSDEGRNFAAAITSLMTANAYESSADMAKNLGTFTHFEFNKEPMIEVMEKHRQNLDDIVWDYVPKDLKKATTKAWDNVIRRGRKVGFRNAQATVIAPTGTISYLMGNDTTGPEPALSLIYMKDLAGGGNIKLVNREVPNALKNLGYDNLQIKDISEHIENTNTAIGAPHLNPDHYKVFATAFGNAKGEGSISFEGHVKMLGAMQPFVSGAISKTNNLPEEATVKEVFDGYKLGHDLGLKALAIFRNNSKPISALNFGSKGFKKFKRGEQEDLPERRNGFESEVEINGTPFHVLVSEYDNGKPGQLVFLSYKSGSTVKALLETQGILASKAMRRGVDLEDVVSGWLGQEFKPSGFVKGHDSIKQALSPLDFAAKFLMLEYKGVSDYANDPESVRIEDLRGFQNGAFNTYERENLDDWDFDQVLNDSLTGGFKNGIAKENRVKSKALKNNNARGVPCEKCGNLMTQTSPNCYTCGNCAEKLGGCGL